MVFCVFCAISVFCDHLRSLRVFAGVLRPFARVCLLTHWRAVAGVCAQKTELLSNRLRVQDPLLVASLFVIQDPVTVWGSSIVASVLAGNDAAKIRANKSGQTLRFPSFRSGRQPSDIK